MPIKAAKITSKGQTTIPKVIRDILKTNVIEFEINEGKVILKPVYSIGGSLSKYSKGYTSLKNIRDNVWEEVVRDRITKKTA